MPSYDPSADAAKRWEHWHITTLELPGLGEFADRDNQIFAIEPNPDERAALAHAIAHLDLGHADEPGDFTEAQCDAADRLARRRLRSRQPVIPAAALVGAAVASLSSLIKAASLLV